MTEPTYTYVHRPPEAVPMEMHCRAGEAVQDFAAAAVAYREHVAEDFVAVHNDRRVIVGWSTTVDSFLAQWDAQAPKPRADPRPAAREAVAAWEQWTEARSFDEHTDAATRLDAAMTALREVAT